MTAPEIDALIRRWYEEVWNQRREETIRELLSPDFLIRNTDGSGGHLRGPEAFVQMHRYLLNAFPDLRMTVRDVAVADNEVRIDWHLEATHRGEFFGMMPTNRPVVFEGYTTGLLRDGQFVEAEDHWDAGQVKAQMA